MMTRLSLTTVGTSINIPKCTTYGCWTNNQTISRVNTQ